MTHTRAARSSLAHAAEHEAGTCTLGCTSTGDDFRELAERETRAAAARFAALDDHARQAYVRASRILSEVRGDQTPFKFSDRTADYAFKLGKVESMLAELLDLVGLLPEE